MSPDTFSSRPILQRLLNQIYNYDRDIFMDIEAEILVNRFLVCYQSKSQYEKKITNTTCHWGNYTDHYSTSIRTLFSPILFLNKYIIFLNNVSYEPIVDVSLRVQKIERDENLQFDPKFFENRTIIPLLFHSYYDFSSMKDSIKKSYKDWKYIRAQLVNEIARNYS